VEQLQDEAVERLALLCRASEERDGTAAQVVAHILQVVAELEQYAPVEGEADFFVGEPGLREAGIGEDRSSALAQLMRRISVTFKRSPLRALVLSCRRLCSWPRWMARRAS